MPSSVGWSLVNLPFVIPTPSPTPTGIDPTQVTPGWIGFTFTAFVIVAAILLIIDMVRRIRRVRYREEARERIAAEIEADGAGRSGAE
ncbi:MAG: hypothetical protein J7480_02465 [Microbacteriaceae bacterium]|nr:hypothetical protein [Microbacteriaceae bacterium]